jgi:hypothetical protein
MAQLPFWKSFGNLGALRNIETHQQREVREHARTDILITRVSLADQLGKECHEFLDNAQKALDKGHVEPTQLPARWSLPWLSQLDVGRTDRSQEQGSARINHRPRPLKCLGQFAPSQGVVLVIAPSVVKTWGFFY